MYSYKKYRFKFKYIFGATSTEIKNQLQIQQQLLVKRLRLSPKYNLFLKFM